MATKKHAIVFNYADDDTMSPELRTFFQTLGETLLDSDAIDLVDLAEAESSEMVIPSVHHFAKESLDEGKLSEEDFMRIVENFVVLTVVYFTDLQMGIVVFDFTGEASDSSEEDWG
tara:strand:- start:6039 stop:6386 length:348 start_codon:yes stop_codon:yes gene_type:complete